MILKFIIIESLFFILIREEPSKTRRLLSIHVEHVELSHLIENINVLLSVDFQSKVFGRPPIVSVVNPEFKDIAGFVLAFFYKNRVVLIFSLVRLVDLVSVSIDAPVLEWGFVETTSWRDHSIIIALKSKVKISFLFMNYSRKVIFVPSLSIIDIIPIVGVTFSISKVSNLELIKARKELRFIHKEDSVVMRNPRVYTMRNLSNELWSPNITHPGSTPTRAAVLCSCKIIIVVRSTHIRIVVVPRTCIAVVILYCKIAVAERSRPLAIECLRG